MQEVQTGLEADLEETLSKLLAQVHPPEVRDAHELEDRVLRLLPPDHEVSRHRLPVQDEAAHDRLRKHPKHREVQTWNLRGWERGEAVPGHVLDVRH